jgi:hypothetical protein
MDDNIWIGGSSTAWNTAGNWSTGSVPTSSDNVIFDHRAQNNCAAFDASAVTLTSLRITSGFTKYIGTYSAGVLTRLQLSATNIVIGEPMGDGQTGAGSQMIALDTGTVATTIRVLSSNTSGVVSGFAPILLKGSNSSNSITVVSGWVGIGTVILAEVVQFPTINVTGGQAVVEVGTGYTAGSGTTPKVNQTAGRVIFRHALTTLNQEGGLAISEGSGAIVTADVGGTFISNSTGAITTLNVQDNGLADFSQSTVARTVTNTNVYGTGRINAESGVPKHITFTNPIALARGAKSPQVNFGPDLSIQQS